MSEKRRPSNGNGASTSWVNYSSPLLTLSEFISKNSPESIILKRMRSQSPSVTPAISRALFGSDIVDLLEGLDRRKDAALRREILSCGCNDPISSYHRNVCNNGFQP